MPVQYRFFFHPVPLQEVFLFSLWDLDLDMCQQRADTLVRCYRRANMVCCDIHQQYDTVEAVGMTL